MVGFVVAIFKRIKCFTPERFIAKEIMAKSQIIANFKNYSNLQSIVSVPNLFCSF